MFQCEVLARRAALSVLASSVLVLSAGIAAAEVNLDWVTVGDPANADDVRGDGYGGVGYEYQIGRYEITNRQYREFLNAVAVQGDPHEVYDPLMADVNGGIARTGEPGSYRYLPKDGDAAWDTRPVNYVNFYDALRFINWLHNGRPVAAQDRNTTEDGVYDMSIGSSMVRQAGARVFMPNEDEWYKAAFYKGGSADAGYWEYATQSDTVPDNNPPELDSGNSANHYATDYAVGPPYFTTDVGAYQQSESPYGTYDQSGNVWEWSETVVDGKWQVVRGGPWLYDSSFLSAESRVFGLPVGTCNDTGFRVARIPEHAKLTSTADGNWGEPTTWNGGTMKPAAEHDAVVTSHNVRVESDENAFSLQIEDSDGQVVVDTDRQLDIVTHLDVAEGSLDVLGTLRAGYAELGAGTLRIASTGTLHVDHALSLAAGSEYVLRLSAEGTGLISSAGGAYLGGTLTPIAAGPLRAPGEGGLAWYGDQTRTILTAGNVVGTFTEVPPTVPEQSNPQNHGQGHLGHGVFLTDRGSHAQPVTYEPDAVKLDLFQATPGDTNGNRYLDGYDVQAILAANTFATGIPADWTSGDFNGDQLCDGQDIQAILATALWDPHSSDPYAAIEPGTEADGGVDLVLSPQTGNLKIDTDFAVINGYVITSAAGVFSGGSADNLGWFVEDTDRRLSGNMGFALDGRHELGEVIGSQWLSAGVDWLEDLTFTYTIEGTPGTFVGALIVPEPATVAMLIALGLSLLLPAVLRRAVGR